MHLNDALGGFGLGRRQQLFQRESTLKGEEEEMIDKTKEEEQRLFGGGERTEQRTTSRLWRKTLSNSSNSTIKSFGDFRSNGNLTMDEIGPGFVEEEEEAQLEEAREVDGGDEQLEDWPFWCPPFWAKVPVPAAGPIPPPPFGGHSTAVAFGCQTREKEERVTCILGGKLA
jgi:hypothetical protein